MARQQVLEREVRSRRRIFQVAVLKLKLTTASRAGVLVAASISRKLSK